MNSNKNNLDAIFFDFDGVLADSLDIKGQAFLSLFCQYPQQTQEAIKKHFYMYTGRSRQEKLKHIYQHILQQTLSEQKLEELCKLFQQRCLKAVITSREINGAQALLDALPNHIHSFVVSGTPEDELLHIVNSRGMAKYFTEVRGTPTQKEDNIGQLLKHYHLSSDRCLMLGDGLIDKQAADTNSLPFFGIVPPEKTSPFPNKTRIFPDLNAVAHRLLQTAVND